MDWGNFTAGLAGGTLAGFMLWGVGVADPAHIQNLKASTDEYGPAYVLAKRGPGDIAQTDQVAIIHGLADDRVGCQTMADAMTADGGRWYCIPVDQVRR